MLLNDEEITTLRQRVAELEKENSIERNLRIGVEAGFDCANEELGRLKARIENLMLDSEQWRIDCHTYCDAVRKREAAITSLQAERDKATQYWQIAEGRCDALMKQRDSFKDAAEYNKRRADDAESQRDDLLAFVEEVRRTGDTRLASMAITAIASVKEKQNAAD